MIIFRRDFEISLTLSNGLRLTEMLGLGECILHGDRCKSLGVGGLIVAGCTVDSTTV